MAAKRVPPPEHLSPPVPHEHVFQSVMFAFSVPAKDDRAHAARLRYSAFPNSPTVYSGRRAGGNRCVQSEPGKRPSPAHHKYHINQAKYSS